jgi:hypothetical protein
MNVATDAGQALLMRVEGMERRVRWITALSVVLALLCGALIAWQFFPQDALVEARGFVVRDASWRTRAELRVRKDGSPVLRLSNHAGRNGAVLSLRDDGAVSLRLYDNAEQERAEIKLDEHGTPAFSLTGSNGTARVTLTTEDVGDESDQRIVLRNRAGRTVWEAPPPAPAP